MTSFQVTMTLPSASHLRSDDQMVEAIGIMTEKVGLKITKLFITQCKMLHYSIQSQCEFVEGKKISPSEGVKSLCVQFMGLFRILFIR